MTATVSFASTSRAFSKRKFITGYNFFNFAAKIYGCHFFLLSCYADWAMIAIIIFIVVTVAFSSMAAPRAMATIPVRTISRMPKGRKTSTKLSILLRIAGDFDDQGFVGDIHDARAVYFDQLHDFAAVLSGLAETLISARSRLTMG